MFVREILSKQGYLSILSIELLFSFYITDDLHLRFCFLFSLNGKFQKGGGRNRYTSNSGNDTKAERREMRSCLLHILHLKHHASTLKIMYKHNSCI